MKRLLLAAVSLAGLSLAVQAADFAEPAPAYDWTGFYGAAFIGYGWGEADLKNEDFLSEEGSDEGGPSLEHSLDPEGVFGGMRFGYDFGLENFIIGIFGEAALAHMRDDSEFIPPDDDTIPADQELAPSHIDYTINWYATLEAKLGWAFSDETMVYIHGGGAWAEVDVEGRGIRGPYVGAFWTDTVSGWTAGAGIEHRFTDDLSVFAEYAYFDYSDVDVEFSEPDVELEHDLEIHTGKVGVMFRFN